MFRFSVCACALFFVINSPAAAKSIVFLNNGDRLSGTVIDKDQNGTLTLQMEAGPEIKLPKAMITKVQTLAATPDPRQAAAPESTSVAPKDKPAEQDPLKWSGRVEFGGELQTGNSETESLTFDGRLKARDRKNRYQADFEYNRAEDEGTITDDDMELALQYEHFLNERWFAGATTSFKNDDVAELDLRSRIGVLTGYQFYDREDLSLSASGGISYINENFANQSTDTSIALTQNTDYEQSFLEDKFRLFYEHDLLVPFEDTSAFIFDSEGGLRVPVTERFLGIAEVNFDWDNDPADGVKEEDVVYKLKLGYEF